MGQITFSGTDLVAPATVHIAKHCYERTSVVAFDAADVTVFLVPWMDPMCGMGMGMPPTGRGRNGAFIEGHLQWPADMREMEWDNVPAARTGWTRVAYVYTTQIDVNVPNPDPGAGGGTARVLESPVAEDGFPYRIFARPAGLAVYALAGLEEESTGRFVPYVMGVARNPARPFATSTSSWTSLWITTSTCSSAPGRPRRGPVPIATAFRRSSTWAAKASSTVS